MKTFLIVQYASDRITHVGPAFSDKDLAQRVADTYPEEWHAMVSAVDLDPDVSLYTEKVNAGD